MLLLARLAEIVDGMEERADKPRDADEMQAMVIALRDAIAGLKPPVVNVSVPPAPAVSAPAPAAVVMPQDKAGQQWRVEIERTHQGPTAPIKSLIVTRL
jgi:hypothetical protein